MPFTSITHEGLTLHCFPAYDQNLFRLALRALRSLDVRDPERRIPHGA